MPYPLLIRCAPGIAKLCLKELQYYKIIHKSARTFTLYQRNHDLIFLPKAENFNNVSKLRLAEDVFECLLFGQNHISEAQLDKLAAMLKNKEQYLALSVDGAHFKRQDLKRMLASALSKRNIKIAENASAALWGFFIDHKYYIGRRIFDFQQAPLRNKRIAERPGSLPVTIAAAAAFWANPQKRETIFDPTCGSGTLLAEAFAIQPGLSEVTGCDIDPEAIAIAKKNLRHIPDLTLHNDEGQYADLSGQNINITISNLPFGKQYGDTSTNRQLYTSILEQSMRTAHLPSWRGIFITSDENAFREALSACKKLNLNEKISVKIQGETASIYSLFLSPDKQENN
jgi:tRNA G10  N-methylase Trm11